MKRLTVTLFSVMFAWAALIAQDDSAIFGTPPPQPGEFGKCYAKCKMPDQYDYVERQVLVKEGGVKSSSSKAAYETVTEQVLVQEGYKKLKVVPAKFSTTEKRVLVKEGACKIITRPAKYETQTSQELVSAAYGKWVRKKKAPNCLSANPEDCYVLCWEEIPARYKTNTARVLVQGESQDTTYSDAQYKTMTVKTLIEPARVEEEYVPPVYKTVSRQVLANCGGTTNTYTEAQFKTKREKVLVSAGGYTDWVEVVCANNINNNLVSSVQRALNAKGYDAGAVDGVMGARTRAALAKFQKDNGLPVGNMNIATMQALGVK